MIFCALHVHRKQPFDFAQIYDVTGLGAATVEQIKEHRAQLATQPIFEWWFETALGPVENSVGHQSTHRLPEEVFPAATRIANGRRE